MCTDRTRRLARTVRATNHSFGRDEFAAQLDELLASKGVAIDKVINLEIDDDLLVKRIVGRWVDGWVVDPSPDGTDSQQSRAKQCAGRARRTACALVAPRSHELVVFDSLVW